MEHVNLTNDIIYEILLRADLETIRQYYMTHKNNLSKDESFWKDKLKGKIEFNRDLPSIYIDDIRTVTWYMDNLEIKNICDLGKILYQHMRKVKDTANKILLINKIESTSEFNKSEGVIIIELYESYEEQGSDALINILPNFDFILDNCSANKITITLLEKNYIFEFKFLDFKTEKFQTYASILSEDQILHMLTLFLFDSNTLFVIDIISNNGTSFLPWTRDINYNDATAAISFIDRQRVWDTLKYLKI
jgi:hypothetical protein